LIATQVQLVISTIGVISTMVFFYLMMKKTNSIESKFTPIVEKVFSTIGVNFDSMELVFFIIEREMINDFMKTSFPELGIGLDVLYDIGILNDERYDELKENPEILILLINRWLPILKQLAPQLLKGKTVQESIKYDL